MTSTEKRIINIDSRFRTDPRNTTSTDFTVNLPSPIRNVKTIRLTTEEIPNVFYAFNTDSTTVFQVRKGPESSGIYTHQAWTTLFIEPGNYDASTLRKLIETQIGQTLGFEQAATNQEQLGFRYTINSNTGANTLFLNKDGNEYGDLEISGGAPNTFELNLTPVDLNEVYDIAVENGAFDTSYVPTPADSYIQEIDVYAQAIRQYVENLSIGDITIKEVIGFADYLLYAKDSYSSTAYINTTGYQYALLDVNGYETMKHISKDNELNVFAKLPLTVGKNFTKVGSVGTTAISKIFDIPETIRFFKIRMFDVLGNVLNLRTLNVSFTFEVEYYITQKAYDKARDSKIPSGSLTNFASESSRTSYQAERKQRLRNVVFKS